MPLPDRLTIGAKYGPAMEVSTQEEADQMFEVLVEHSMRPGQLDRVQAEALERQNLGYYAGYYSHETRERVERLFHCVHPMLGAASDGQLSFEEILKLGMKLGETVRNPSVWERLDKDL